MTIVASMKNLLPLSSLTALLLLGACASTAPFGALPIEDDVEMTTNVVVTNADLHGALRVGRARVERIEGSDQLKVVVPIRNISEDPLQVRVQVSFLDLEKLPIGDDTNSQVQLIGPGDTINHAATSMTKDARDWIMRIVPNS
jgi:hypothetical protein